MLHIILRLRFVITITIYIYGASGRNSRTNIPTLLNMIESVVLASYAPGKGSLALHDALACCHTADPTSSQGKKVKTMSHVAATCSHCVKHRNPNVQ